MAIKRKRKKSKRLQRLRPLSILMLAAALALNCALDVALLSPKRYSIAEGDAAEAAISAPRTIEDPVSTEKLKQQARDSVETIYAVDTARANNLAGGARAFFDSVTEIRSDAQAERIATAPTVVDAEGNVVPAEDVRTWRAVFTEENVLLLFTKLPVQVSDAALCYGVLNASDGEVDRLSELVTARLSVALSDGVSETQVESLRASISRELQLTTLPAYLKQLGEIVYDNYFRATYIADTAATMAAKEAAADAVEPVYITRGTVVVERGQIVTGDHMTVLLALDLVRGVNENTLLSLGVSGYLLLLYGLFGLYLARLQPDVWASSKLMLVLMLILMLTIVLEWPCYLLEPQLIPVLLGVILSTSLLSPQVGSAVGVLTSLSLGVLAGGTGSAMMGSDALTTVAATLVASQAAVTVIRANARRSSLIAAGAAGAGAGALCVLACAAILHRTWRALWVPVLCQAASPLVLAVFSVGMLPVWENAFDIVTAPRLHELLNANHPLLRKMMTSAPGTYHHSAMAASLAENAAETIGANALLARAGAMYHDVGKLRRPQYFMENQSGTNIHDTLPPRESAEIIMAHVPDADPLLTHYRLPEAVRQIAFEHHGSTLVAYFYYKAKNQCAEGESVEEASFRYPASPPSTKESAIVMLADSCEAAVRSLSDPTREEVAAMVKKVIKGKIDDGQLAQSPLTFQEISRIERSFLVTINGLLHERIRYPEEKKE